jgi:HEAT repeat protein
MRTALVTPAERDGEVTPILHSARVMPRSLPVVWLALLAAQGCSHTAEPAKPPAARPLGLAGLTAPSAPAATLDQPATHVGRVALSRADVIVCGKVTRATPAAHGAIVAQVAASQWLRGEPPEDEAPLVVMTPSARVLPGAGREALFLLATRRGTDNHELVDVAPLDDSDGVARLSAMKKYLEIEAIPDGATRVAELRAYLRGALASDQKWTRSNAVREFAALAEELPGSLEAEDRPALEAARARTREPALATLLQAALDECPGDAIPRPRAAAAEADASDPVAAAAVRFDAADASPSVRRQAVIDAAVAAGARAAPLFARALDDEAPEVREAAAAAAGEHRIASLEPRIAAMLADDPSTPVRKTLVVAAGYLKSSASVPTLAILAKEGRPFAVEASFALARIRDDAAVAALNALAAEASDKDRRAMLEFLLSEKFLEQERALSDTR